MSKRYYHNKESSNWAIVIDDDARVLYLQYIWSNSFERCTAEYTLWADKADVYAHWQRVTKCQLRKWLKAHKYKDQVIP